MVSAENKIAGTSFVNIAGTSSSALAQMGVRIRKLLDIKDTALPALQVFKGQRIAIDAFAESFSRADLRLLVRCGVLDDDGSTLGSAFCLHLVEDFLILTDPDVPTDQQAPLYLDPLWEGHCLARILVRGFSHSSLDMGSGCGVLSLIMARYSEEVIGVDINPRAVALAKFNAAINNVRNVAYVNGDLFKPVRGRKFNRIVFNSPVDAIFTGQPEMLSTGEDILARFFGELPQYLTSDGYCQVNLEAKDLPGSNFNSRLSLWLGPEAKKFQRLILLKYEKVIAEDERMWRGWLTMRRGQDSFPSTYAGMISCQQIFRKSLP
jgi:SAM-dependent methyltransferase